MRPTQDERNQQNDLSELEDLGEEGGYAADDNWDTDYPVFATKETTVKMADTRKK